MAALRIRLGIGQARLAHIYLALAALAVLYRCAAFGFHGVDTDEFDHINLAWYGLQGHSYYPSNFGIISHLYWELLQPLIQVFGERAETLLVTRGCSLVISLVTFTLWYRFGRAVHGQPTAWVAPLAFTFVVFGARLGVEVRPDVPQMLCYVLALPLVTQLRLDGPARRIALVGFLLGLASLFKQTAFVLGALLLLHIVWHNRDLLWPVRAGTFGIVGRAALFGLAPVVLLWLACALHSGVPGTFLWQTLVNVPHLHGEGQTDYSGLWFGLRLDPWVALVPALFLVSLVAQLVKRGQVYHPRAASLGLVVVCYTAVDILAARNYGDAHFLQVAMLVAVTGAYLAGWSQHDFGRLARPLCAVVLVVMAANVLAIEPRLASRKETHERLPKQLATVRFLLEHTPAGSPVLGSYPFWMFRPGGEHINPPEIPEILLIAHDSTHLNLDRQVLIDDFTSQPAVFVHMDGWMREIMSEAPEIGAFIRDEYELWCYAPGNALLAVHNELGQHVPRDQLVRSDGSRGSCEGALLPPGGSDSR